MFHLERPIGRMSETRSNKHALIVMSLVPRVLLLLFSLCISVNSSPGAPKKVSKPNCPETCGDVTIPFPFGIGPGCFLDEWYEVFCQQKDRAASVPRLKKMGLEVLNISLPTGNMNYNDGSINVSFPISYSSPDCTNGVATAQLPSLVGSNFVFSQFRNIFTVVGCGELAYMKTTEFGTVGCRSKCEEQNMTRSSECSGYGCYCTSTVPSYFQAFNVSFDKSGGDISWALGCAYVFLVDQSCFKPNVADLFSLRNIEYMPVLLGWGIASDTGSAISLINSENHGLTYSCGSCSYDKSSCVELPFLQCYCHPGYEGNPYLGQGCQDIDKCRDPKIHRCPGKCATTDGSFKCVADGRKTKQAIMAILGGSVGALLFFLSVRWLWRTVKRRKSMKLKQKFFKQNGGLLLQQQLASPEGNVGESKLFNSKVLEKATDNFNKNRILGRGGQGTVYKGMLTDGRIVAVKKSQALDKGNVKQFINEVFILSQINHRNVVKLLGCCLETAVPLLVYEFIPNGTLYQYLHDPDEEFPVPWDVRLRIASEVAGAVFYLHSAASIPIYRRDIKSTNILLDEKYRAKIADFGTSKSVALDQTHVTTLVHGTFGYLDPEYFQSSQFTDKSDVYSFGVVLVELLTGEKPICSLRAEEGRSLASYFILSLEEDRLFDILDAQVLDQGNREDIVAIAQLAKRCLKMKGRNRPTMKEVAMELEAIRKPSHPSHVQEITESYEDFEIYGIEARDIASGLAGSEASDTMSSTIDFNPV